MPSPRPKLGIPSQPVPMANWQPDAPIISDGAVQDAFNYFPVTAGMRTFPGQRVLGGGLPAPCMGFFSDLLINTPLFVAATANALFVADSNTNLQPASVNFTNTKNRWRFDAYGTPTGTTQSLIATNGIDPVQYFNFYLTDAPNVHVSVGTLITDSNGNTQRCTTAGITGTSIPTATGITPPTGFSTWATTVGATTQDGTAVWTLTVIGATGTWAALPGNPPLSSIVTASDFALILVQPNSQQFVTSFNLLPGSWVGNEPLQVYQQGIPQSPGNITACHRLRNTVVFYKRKAAHLAYFAGGTTGWDVQDSSMQQGVLNQEWVINTGDMHYFPSMGGLDFWSFDGYNWNRLSNTMAEFFRNDLDKNFLSLLQGRYDSERDMLIWVYASKSATPAGTLDTWLIYYLRTGTWSFQRLPIEFLLTWLDPITNKTALGYFGTDHAPRIYDNALAPGRSYTTSQFFGDYRNMYACDSIKPGFSLLPSSATVTPIIQNVPGTIPPGPPGDIAAKQDSIKEPLDSTGWFRFEAGHIQAACLQAFQIVTYGIAEITSIEVSAQFAGETL